MNSLLLVGCGKMGGALLGGWEQRRAQLNLITIDVIEPDYPHAFAGISSYKHLDALPTNRLPAVIVFAVKPQQLADILPAYQKRFGEHRPLYISIAAGKSLAFFAGHLGENAHVVRAMPNTPALVGEGMTVLCAARTLPQSSRHVASQLMEAVGKVEWLEEESLMDAVTAISGSGPAYVFLFLDALTKAGIRAGLPEKLATKLALQTVAGSCALADAPGADSFEQLRKNVTSPGGTTEAALQILMEDRALEQLVEEAVMAAKERSIELK